MHSMPVAMFLDSPLSWDGLFLSQRPYRVVDWEGVGTAVSTEPISGTKDYWYLPYKAGRCFTAHLSCPIEPDKLSPLHSNFSPYQNNNSSSQHTGCLISPCINVHSRPLATAPCCYHRKYYEGYYDQQSLGAVEGHPVIIVSILHKNFGEWPGVLM